MRITNRRFVYPVLSEEKDDYEKSIFNVEFEHKMEGVNSLKMSFSIAMNCLELEQLISNGYAEYVIHLECSNTAYREIITGISKHCEHVIPIERVNGTLEVVAFIILKKPLNSFSCSDWNEDYNGMSFNLLQGSILAYQNLSELDITKDFEEFTNANSIFRVYRRVTDEDKPADINLESSKIKIGLGSSDYDTYTLYSQKSELQHIINSMLILPVLVYVFEELKQEGGYDAYHHREWYIALDKAYSKRGIVFMDELMNTDKTSFQLAQEAMELPLSKAFEQIPFLYDLSEED